MLASIGAIDKKKAKDPVKTEINAIMADTLANLPPNAWVLAHTRSSLKVQGFLMPMNQFLSAFESKTPMPYQRKARAGTMAIVIFICQPIFHKSDNA